MKNSTRSLLLMASLALVACGGDNPGTDAGADTGPMTDAPMRDTPRTDAGPDDGTFEGARNVPVTPAGTAAMNVMDAIEAPGDHDFWRFDGTAGDWVVIATTANEMDNPMMVDTVITLYDSTRAQIAENDDSIPRVNTDSEIVIRLPSTGTYYVEVQEFSDWMPSMPPDPEGSPSYTYQLAVLQLANGAPFNIPTETGDDAASASPIAFGGTGGNGAFLLGVLDDATDVDVYSFTTTASPGLLSIDVMPAGAAGYGSTRAAARAWVTNMAGTEVLARISPRDMMQDDLSPSLPAGDFLLWVDAGGGTAGANDHYVLKMNRGMENPVEMEIAGMNTNDTTATAEALTVTDDMGTGRAFILARLSATDTDIFSFSPPAGVEMNVFCGSASSGSGLTGLRAELLGPDGTTVLGSGTETATDGAAIQMIAVATAGTHYIRLTATGQSPEVTGNWARCGLALVTPMP